MGLKKLTQIGLVGWVSVSNLTNPAIEPQTSRTDSVRLTPKLTGRCLANVNLETFLAYPRSGSHFQRRNEWQRPHPHQRYVAS